VGLGFSDADADADGCGCGCGCGLPLLSRPRDNTFAKASRWLLVVLVGREG